MEDVANNHLEGQNVSDNNARLWDISMDSGWKRHGQISLAAQAEQPPLLVVGWCVSSPASIMTLRMRFSGILSPSFIQGACKSQCRQSRSWLRVLSIINISLNRKAPAELKAALPPVLHWPVINAIQNNCLAVSKTAGELTDKIKHSIFRIASLSYLLRPSALRSNPCR